MPDTKLDARPSSLAVIHDCMLLFDFWPSVMLARSSGTEREAKAKTKNEKRKAKIIHDKEKSLSAAARGCICPMVRM